MTPNTHGSSKLESAAFYVILVTLIVAPLAFWTNQYFALESVKTIVIALGTIVSATLLLLGAARTKEAHLPPQPMFWVALLAAVSVLASAIASGHFVKSFFGQGFELGTGSFILVLLVGMFVVSRLVANRSERALMLYVALVSPFLFLLLFQGLHIILGDHFIPLGLFNAVTSTILGGWYGLSAYAVAVSIIALMAVIFLPLSSRLRIAYWAIIALSALFAFFVNSRSIWEASAVTFLGLTIYLSLSRPSPDSSGLPSLARRVAWVPLVAFILSAALVYRGNNIAGPLITKWNGSYSELSLPWQLTLDVAVGELKDHPILGPGPNRFSQAFLAHKPAGINDTDAWSIEFNSGFGLIPTLMVVQGLLGTALWALFFVFFGLLGARSLRNSTRPAALGDEALSLERSHVRFVILSSYASAAFLWLVAFIYVPPHAVLFLAFILTGIWLGASVSYGLLKPFSLVPPQGGRAYRALPIVTLVCIVASIVWGLAYLKNTAALWYFGSGVEQLTAAGNASVADKSFSRALTLNPLDIYWQARAEANITMVNQLVSSVKAGASASTTQAAASTAANLVNQSFTYANNAIVSDPDNYYNYLSQARVAELAANLNMANGYEIAIAAYNAAIKLNPNNPSIYLNLARLHASKSQFDLAIQSIGDSLRVKNNYLDAVFFLSQVEAAKGNLPDAIVAAEFATKLDPSNPLLFFQWGLLQYTKGEYVPAVASFTRALALEPSYSNASYFLGLSDARLGKIADAIRIFQDLTKANPDNKDVALILSTLRSGKPLFTGATAAAASPEKKAVPPLPKK